MKHQETEVKFFLTDLQSIRRRILDIGAQSHGRFFESNVRYEDDDRTLKQKKSLLRLRRDQKIKLTFKSTPDEDNAQFKILNELEVEVSDFDTMQLILEALGFHPEQIYEKWRETLVVDDTLFCLDNLPFGDFLEIEGEQQAIKQFAAQLELHWDRRILLNYLQIFEILQEKLNLDFSDVTFDNFADVDVKLIDYREFLEAEDEECPGNNV